MFVILALAAIPGCRSGFLPEAHPCEGVDCSGLGECLVGARNEPVCQCQSGSHRVGRITCEPDQNPCEDVDCSDHGTCLITSYNQAICACDPGFHNQEATDCVEDLRPGECAHDLECDDFNQCTRDSCQDLNCVNSPSPDGSACDDANLCTGIDQCQSGLCLGSNEVICQGPTDCQLAGDCNPATGLCEMDSRPDGTFCADGDECTMDDICVSGTCLGDPLDGDRDSYPDISCGGNDCDDANPDIHPGINESGPANPLCSNTLDDDCDGHVDLQEWACWEPVTTDAGFIWLRLWPAGEDLNAISVMADDEVIAVGDHGLALHYDGASWVREPTGVTVRLRGIHSFGPDDAWAVGDEGVILRYDGTWQQVASPTGESLADVFGSTANTSVAVGDAGTVLEKLDAGEWQVGVSPVASDLNSVWGVNIYDVFASGNFGNIIRFDGANWTLMTVPVSVDYMGLHGVTAADLWAVGDNGTIAHFDGSSWQEHSLGYYYQGHVDIWAEGIDNVWVLGGWLDVIHHFDGQGWSDVSTDNSLHPLAISASGPNDIWVTFRNSVASHFDGSQWINVDAGGGFGEHLNAAFVATPGKLWAASQGGDMLHFDLQGFTTYTNPTGQTIWAIWGSAPNDVWAVGDNGALIHFNGTDWEERTSGTALRLSAIWGTSASDIWAGGITNTVVHYDGFNWTPGNAGVGNTMITDLWGNFPDNFWAVTQDSIMHYDGLDWNLVEEVSSILTGIHGTTAGDLFICGDSGAVLYRP